MQNLYELYATLLLAAGKSVLLSGPPGSGKTRLAFELSRRFTGTPPLVVTGYSNLSYDQLVKPRGGQLLASLIASWLRLASGKPPVWLLFDEINRANVEVVLGPLFTLLDAPYRDKQLLEVEVVNVILSDESIIEYLASIAGVEVNEAKHMLEKLAGIAAKLPLSWRMIATMNIYDQSHLYRIGFALLRRLPMLRVIWLYDLKQLVFSDRACAARLSVELVEKACRSALEELSLVNVYKVDGGLIVDPLSPWVSLSLRMENFDELVEKLMDTKGLWTCLYTLIERLTLAGVEPGFSTLVDTCKLLYLLRTYKHCVALGDVDEEAIVYDIVVSTMLLPMLAAAAKVIRMEALMGGRRLEATAEVLDFVEHTLDRGLASTVARDVRVELGLPEE